jgi:hypothetical protein
MDENQIIDIWSVFKEYIDKKSVEDVAERFVDTLVDYGVSDFTLRDCLGQDNTLDEAIEYYLDEDDNSGVENNEWDD